MKKEKTILQIQGWGCLTAMMSIPFVLLIAIIAIIAMVALAIFASAAFMFASLVGVPIYWISVAVDYLWMRLKPKGRKTNG